MILRGIQYIRHGQHVYKRVADTDVFRVEMIFRSVSSAKRYINTLPEGTAVRWEWVLKKLNGQQLPKLREW